MMTKNEKSLFLYLETRAVDFGGSVDSRIQSNYNNALLQRRLV